MAARSLQSQSSRGADVDRAGAAAAGRGRDAGPRPRARAGHRGALRGCASSAGEPGDDATPSSIACARPRTATWPTGAPAHWRSRSRTRSRAPARDRGSPPRGGHRPPLARRATALALERRSPLDAGRTLRAGAWPRGRARWSPRSRGGCACGRRSPSAPRSLIPVRRRPRVASDSSVIKADAVVLAAGSWSGRWPSSASSGGRAADPGTAPALLCAQPLASRVLWGADSTWSRGRMAPCWPGRRSEDVGFDEHATVAGVRDPLRPCAKAGPGGVAARFEGPRGPAPATSDELPIVGRATRCRTSSTRRATIATACCSRR